MDNGGSAIYLCYMDESGTPSIPGNTTHFVLAGLALPISKWKFCEAEITKIKQRYGLGDEELHTGWMCRPYLEQSRIPEFTKLGREQRRSKVMRLRAEDLRRVQREVKRSKFYRQVKKNYLKTENYIHLTYNERRSFILEVAKSIASWDFARLFAEAINKDYFMTAKPASTGQFPVEDQAFEQVVSRFGTYLNIISRSPVSTEPVYGLLIHDNNQTVSKKHTETMKRFHDKGTRWASIDQIIETPLFVDSQLTSMIQIADLCAYALRRYLENNEEDLFDLVFQRADRKDGVVVGVRHFVDRQLCSCKICQAHSRNQQ